MLAELGVLLTKFGEIDHLQPLPFFAVIVREVVLDGFPIARHVSHLPASHLADSMNVPMSGVVLDSVEAIPLKDQNKALLDNSRGALRFW